MTRRLLLPLLALAAWCHAVPVLAASRNTSSGGIAPERLQSLQWRSIGPYRGGRVTAVAGVIGQVRTFYFGGTGGGVWKTIDGGASWQNVTDGQIGTGSVGAVAVAPSDPNVVYVGMGEACIRGNVSRGNGVYRSVDAGRSWQHLGLEESRQIGRIQVHPRDPDRVYVAALGHAFGPNRERGVYRSLDGGRRWERVLAVNDSTGAVDLAMDPSNPRILYAAFWQVVRTPWGFESGGPGSGLYKTIDGGDTWTRLSGEGLPRGVWGRVGVTVSGARGDRLWAMIEADEGGLFRSDDGGRSWRRTTDDRRLRQRAWYYSHVYADPVNVDAVYVLNVQFLRSHDGGRTFAPVATPHGDNHDLWIDPRDPARMIEGNDGGANVSFDAGASWSRQDNQPTGQFYHVVTDDQFPYYLYGAQQDNSTVAIASRTSGAGIDRTDWYPVGGCESGFVAPRTDDPMIVYAGCYDGEISRYDHRTDELRDISVYPENPMGWGAEGMKYRFQWTFPIVTSPHDPNILYAAGNVLFRSTNDGHSWTAISPDLTRNDPTRLGPSGGPITKDNTSVEYYCTIFAFAESKRQAGLLWAGSDDGRVHVSRDAGQHWSDVTPSAMPPWSMISQIDPSPHDPATAFVAANRYKLDDDRPFAWVTHDYGRSWRNLASGLPPNAFVRAVREDPVRRGLLYAGTELGVFFSPDQGAHWQPLRMHASQRPPTTAAKEDLAGRLPVVPITDLVVKNDDLVVSTQGRGFWILDQLGPLRELADADVAGPRLHSPGPAYLFAGAPGGAGRGQNPPNGAAIDYQLAAEPGEKEEVTLEFLDAAGHSIRKFSSKGDRPEDLPDATEGGEGPSAAALAATKVPTRKGHNRFAWNLRYADARRFKGLVLWGGGLQGPRVLPGRYQVRLTAGGRTWTDSLEVRRNPRMPGTVEEDRARFDLLLAIRDKLTATHQAIQHIRDLRDQIKAVAERSRGIARDSSIARDARQLSARLTTIEEALYQTKNRSSQDPLNYPIRLNNKLSALVGSIEADSGPPTAQAVEVYRDVGGRIDQQLAALRDLLEKDLPSFNRLVREQEIPAVVTPGERKDRGGSGS